MIEFDGMKIVKINVEKMLKVQVSITIIGRYVPSFWTSNPEFEDKKSIFTRKLPFLTNFE